MDKKEKVDKLSKFLYSEFSDSKLKDSENVLDRVNNIIISFSCVCAVVAIMPAWLIPGADFWAISIVQTMMGLKIAEEYGKNMDRSDIIHLVKTLGLAFGLGFLGQQAVLSAYRTIVPVWGAITSFPLVFSASYVIGKAFQYYFENEDKDLETIKKSIHKDWKKTAKDGKKLAGNFKEEVFELKDKAIEFWKNLDN
jgi:uncharacterized protein (DUF697 family)